MRLIFALLIGAVMSATAEIHFMRGVLGDAVKKAAAENKPVMIDFITDWCRWCDTLDARTYSDKAVADYVNARMIAIKIDAEKGEGIDIAKKYGVNGYPTILLVHASGEEIDRILGFVPAEPFLITIRDYVNCVNTLPALV
jgi:thiol:disulfide interchange protein